MNEKHKEVFVDDELEITQEEWRRLNIDEMLESRCILLSQDKTSSHE